MDSNNPATRTSAFANLSRADWLLLTGLSLYMIALCVFHSREHLLWCDELYSTRIMGAATAKETFLGWWDGADGCTFLYYMLGRLCFHVFGPSPLTLRLFSTVPMLGAIFLIWSMARRYVSTLATALAIGIVFLMTDVVRWQGYNGRNYGMFLLAAALASLCFLLAAEAERPSYRLLCATLLAHVFLLASHTLGIVYSASLVLCLAVFDLWCRRRLRLPLYLSALASWVVMFLSLHAIRASASVAQNGYWTQRPKWRGGLIFGLALQSYLTFGLLVVLVAAALAVHFLRKRRTSPSLSLSAWFLVGSFVFAEVLIVVKSQFGTSIFSDRYLFPLTIGLVLVFAACFSVLVPRGLQQSGSGSALAAIALAVIGASVFRVEVNPGYYAHPGYVENATALLPSNLPVLATNPWSYMLLSHYDTSRVYLTMTDWNYDLVSGHYDGSFSDAHLMENAVQAGYDRGRILPCHDLVNQWPAFTVVLSPERKQWLNDRFLQNPDYSVRAITTVKGWIPLTVWSVQRVKAGAAPC